MGIFSRLSDIITANVNALLDRAEDPERMLAQIIREMEDGLARAREQGAAAIAAERRLQRELEQNRTLADNWTSQARLALGEGREDLARQALARKIEHEDLVLALEPQWRSARAVSDDVKDALHTLAARLAEARRKQRTLTARHRVAAIRLDAHHAVETAASTARSPFNRLSRFEEKLNDMEDNLLGQVEISLASTGIEPELAKLEQHQRIEAALESLKRELQQSG